MSGELIVSGLDSATSLIQAAKNLMNAVVLTVKVRKTSLDFLFHGRKYNIPLPPLQKASYVASTKYPRKLSEASAEGRPFVQIVVWKMKVPEKKPLVRREAPEEVRAKVRR